MSLRTTLQTVVLGSTAFLGTEALANDTRPQTVQDTPPIQKAQSSVKKEDESKPVDKYIGIAALIYMYIFIPALVIKDTFKEEK